MKIVDKHVAPVGKEMDAELIPVGTVFECALDDTTREIKVYLCAYNEIINLEDPQCTYDVHNKIVYRYRVLKATLTVERK